MAINARVIRKRDGVERVITAKAYGILPSIYNFVQWEDENGNVVDSPNGQKPRLSVAPQEKRVAEPVARVKPTAEEIAEKRAELDAMNAKQVALAQARMEEENKKVHLENQVDEKVEEKKKRGRPAKVNA